MLCGLIGAGIQRSLTPALQEEEARRHGLRLHYQLIDLERAGVGAEALPGLLHAAATMGFSGLNITHPCKQAVLPLLDELSADAAAMGAVNTVLFRAGRTLGHNTDGSGWLRGFQRALPDADTARVVLLGAGGAGAAIAHALLRVRTVGELLIVDREAAKAVELVRALRARADGGGRAHAVTDVDAAMRGATGLIHATPTGMVNHPGLALPAHLLRPALWVSEIVYFPFATALLDAARAVGCRTMDGGHMAVGQAVDAFRLFTGREPDAERMSAHFRSLVMRAA